MRSATIILTNRLDSHMMLLNTVERGKMTVSPQSVSLLQFAETTSSYMSLVFISQKLHTVLSTG